MTPAYIVLAHKRADLLLRLVDALDGAHVAIHIDRKSNILPDVKAGLGARRNVALLPQRNSHWGGFGNVRASLDGLRWFLTTDCDYAMHLSGQCYPLKGQREIAEGLASLGGRSLLETSAFPKREWAAWENGGYRRIDRHYFRLGSALRSLRTWKRKLPGGLHPHGGSAFWALTREAAAFVTNFADTNPAVLRFFSSTHMPDEMFYQTVLSNSPLRNRLTNTLLHYTDWSDGGAHPAILTEARLSAALESGFWFGRKFEDAAVLDVIDGARMVAQPLARRPAGGR